MIVQCPNCDTQYEIPVELPPEGRRVRCSSCQLVWTAMPEHEAKAEEEPSSGAARELLDFEDDEIIFQESPDGEDDGQPSLWSGTEQAEAATPEADVATEEETSAAADDEEMSASGDDADSGENELEQALSQAARDAEDDAGFDGDDEYAGEYARPAGDGAATQDDPEDDLAGESYGTEQEPESPPIVIGSARKRSLPVPGNVAMGWAALALVVAGIAGIAYFQRVGVVRALPGAAGAYEAIGLPVNVRGLEFENVKYSWETSAGRPMLEVYGDIVNVTPRSLRVPTVVFGLRTREKVEVYQWAADVRANELPAGERTAFSAQIPTPPKSIRDVMVRFAKVR